MYTEVKEGREQNVKYYKVMCERGHLGNGKSADLVFYFKAKDAYDALCKGKKMPAVKHTRCPLVVKEIEPHEYFANIHTSAYRR